MNKTVLTLSIILCLLFAPFRPAFWLSGEASPVQSIQRSIDRSPTASTTDADNHIPIGLNQTLANLTCAVGEALNFTYTLSFTMHVHIGMKPLGMNDDYDLYVNWDGTVPTLERYDQVLRACPGGDEWIVKRGVPPGAYYFRVYDREAIDGLGFNITLQVYYAIHNLDIGLDYGTIQEAIDAPETLDGHTVLVDTGVYYEHVVVNKSLSLIGEELNTVVDGSDTGTVMNITAKNVNVTGFTLQKSGYAGCGIYISESSSGGNISKNLLLKNDYGIRLYECSGNVVSENNIRDNIEGIDLDGADYNLLSGNNIANNNLGIGLHYSSETTGTLSALTTNTIITRNNLTGNNWSGIWVWGSSNNVISDNKIVANTLGIELVESTNCNISENSIANNMFGIHLWKPSTSGNSIYRNDITDNHPSSIWIEFSSNNTIYNNNLDGRVDIYGASTNVWDGCYPSGGNYWSDYAGLDLHNGPYQNRTGFDGVGDTAYIIDQNNTDRYPLMHPFILEAEEVRVAYRNLLGDYNELLTDSGALNTTYQHLSSDHYELQERFASLNLSYTGLQANYSTLNTSFNNYRTLIQDELSNTRNLVYALTAIAVILVVAIVYPVVRKSRTKLDRSIIARKDANATSHIFQGRADK